MADGQNTQILGLGGGRQRIAGPDTGGGNIGSWGQVGGRIPGLAGASAIAADVIPVLGERAILKRRAAKNYNDGPTSTTVGTDGGQVVKDAGELAGMTASF